eukprot:COSAG06_NODE_56823_length_283_cov_0.559783_1_plen_77_part_10
MDLSGGSCPASSKLCWLAAFSHGAQGFRIHYDFNSTRSLAAVLPIVRELEANHPIVAFIEDALQWDDIEGYKQLRAQ